MSENEPRPSENPYGSQPPTNPYGQPVPTSPEQSPSSGSSEGGDPPPTQGGYPQQSQGGYPQQQPEGGYPQQSQGGYPQQPQGGYPPAPYGNDPYAVGAYGGQRPGGDKRPGTVTAAGWITIVMSALSTLLFLAATLFFLVAQEPMMDEIQRQPEFQDLDVDAGSIVGIIVAVMIVLALWSAIGIVLGIFVLKRSNVARILLVISSAVLALFSLLGITSGLSAVSLVAAVAVIVLLFVGGANDWFARRSSTPYGGPSYGGPGSPYGGSHQPYGGSHQEPYDPNRP